MRHRQVRLWPVDHRRVRWRVPRWGRSCRRARITQRRHAQAIGPGFHLMRAPPVLADRGELVMRAVPGEYQPYRVRLEAAGRDECPVGVIGPEAAAVERALEVLFALGHEVIPYGQAEPGHGRPVA